MNVFFLFDVKQTTTKEDDTLAMHNANVEKGRPTGTRWRRRVTDDITSSVTQYLCIDCHGTFRTPTRVEQLYNHLDSRNQSTETLVRWV